MGRIAQGESTPPFLKKLHKLTTEAESTVCCWSDDGKVYNVLNDQKFMDLLKKYFKGNAQTFIRQLHFYGFRKIEPRTTELNVATNATSNTSDKQNDVLVKLKGSSVSSSSVAWAFEHEQHFFVRDNPDLVKEIRRKTKVDPATQQLASYTEVEALKSQVNYLQHTIEDLRTQLDSVITLAPSLNETSYNFSAADKRDGQIFRMSESEIKGTHVSSPSFAAPSSTNKNKRPRRSFSTNGSISTRTNSTEFDRLCATVTPPGPRVRRRRGELQSRNASMSIGSIDTDDIDAGSLSDLFSDFEISEMSDTEIYTDLPKIKYEFPSPRLGKNDMKKPLQAVKIKEEMETDVVPSSSSRTQDFNKSNGWLGISAIAEATKVKETDVEKILTYLSQISLKATEPVITSKAHRTPVSPLAVEERIRMVEFDWAGPRVQKVGAN